MNDTKMDSVNYFTVYEKERYLITNFSVEKLNLDSIVQPKFLIKGLNLLRILPM